MIRVFPRKTKWTPTDDLVFIGEPGLFRPPVQPVRISCVFTWDLKESQRLYRAWSHYYPDVKVGGPAYNDPGKEFIPGKFVKNGIIHTSRGCIKKCPWCFVPEREGLIRELPIRSGWNVNDNNLLACSMKHIENVFKMLQNQNKAIIFSGGIDAEIFNKKHVDLFNSIKIGEIWFACDRPQAIVNIEKISNLLSHIPPRKKRCYVLIGFNGETLIESEERLKTVYRLGFWPFAMLYQPMKKTKTNWSSDWRNLQRLWTRPAAFKNLT